MRILLPLGILIAFGLACSNTHTEINRDDSTKPTPKFNSKITSTYNSERGETDVTQEEMAFYPNVFIKNQKLNQKHLFTLFNLAAFKGTAPSNQIVPGAGLSISHEITTKNLWHFPAKTKATLYCDDKAIQLNINRQWQLEKELPTDKTFIESIIIEADTDLYRNIAKAKAISFQIGEGRFDLGENEISTLRDFVATILQGD